MELIGADGVQGLTIARVCAALDVTKGSFYHHFRGIEDFRTQLLAHWSHAQEAEVAAAVSATPDPYDRLDVLRRFAVSMPHEAEAAIRAWSRSDDEAWRVREKVDAARERAVAGAYREVGIDPDVADVLGRVAVAILIGAQHRSESTDRAVLEAMYSVLHDVALTHYATTTSTDAE